MSEYYKISLAMLEQKIIDRFAAKGLPKGKSGNRTPTKSELWLRDSLKKLKELSQAEAYGKASECVSHITNCCCGYCVADNAGEVIVETAKLNGINLRL